MVRRRRTLRGLPRRGVGPSRRRRPTPLREAHARRLPGGSRLDHDPAQARGVSRSVPGLRGRAGRALPRGLGGETAEEPGDRAAPGQDRSCDLQRARRTGDPAYGRVAGRFAVALRGSRGEPARDLAARASADPNTSVRGAVEGAAAARLAFSRTHERLRVHAERRHVERPHRGLLRPRRSRAAAASPGKTGLSPRAQAGRERSGAVRPATLVA